MSFTLCAMLWELGLNSLGKWAGFQGGAGDGANFCTHLGSDYVRRAARVQSSATIVATVGGNKKNRMNFTPTYQLLYADFGIIVW